MKGELQKIEEEIVEIRQRKDYLGKEGLMEAKKLEKQLNELRTLYSLRKRACFDLIEVFTELYKEDEETFKAKAGLDQDDFEDENIQELLQVYNEVKLGLGDDEEDEEMEEEESEDELYDPAVK